MTAHVRGAAEAAAIEDFLWLLSVGEDIDRALTRVGLSAAAMDAKLRRAGAESPAGLAHAVNREKARRRNG